MARTCTGGKYLDRKISVTCKQKLNSETNSINNINAKLFTVIIVLKEAISLDKAEVNNALNNKINSLTYNTSQQTLVQ